MALTQGQKKQRDREIAEAATREETVRFALPFWIEKKTHLKYQHGTELVERVLKQIFVDTLSIQELIDSGVIEIMPVRFLKNQELSDELLVALANGWMDNTKTLRLYYKHRNSDASFKGVSYELEKSADTQFEKISATHLKRMKELADKHICAMPPVLRRPRLFYSSEMDEYRSWMEFIGCTPEE
jgi:hypothetical protein